MPDRGPIVEESWVRRRARRLLGPRLRCVLDSADLAQDAHLAALRGSTPGKLTSVRKARAWFTVVLRNLAAKAARRADLIDAASRWSPVEGREATASRGLQTAERREGARALLRELPDRDRSVVTLRIVERLSFRDVARRLDLTEAHARTIFSRSIARLRENPRASELGLE